MTEQLISFETAKLAKEKGFNLPCIYVHDTFNNIEDWRYMGDEFHQNSLKNASVYFSAPTQSLLQRWLREEHGIDLWFGLVNPPNKYHVEDIIKDELRIGGVNKGSKTYEEALELGLVEALKLI